MASTPPKRVPTDGFAWNHAFGTVDVGFPEQPTPRHRASEPMIQFRALHLHTALEESAGRNAFHIPRCVESHALVTRPVKCIIIRG